MELRHLRALVSVVDEGTFTDAGINLGISQTVVSRHVATLESVLGARLLHRTTRSVDPTPAGERVLRHARRVLAAVADLRQEAQEGVSRVRIGYAWSALGKHTPEFQRRWTAALPQHELLLARSNSASAGLLEGTSDMAILRRVPEVSGLEVLLVGLEKRYCAMSADDPLARRRSVTLGHVAESAVVLDHRTGSTTLDLWPEDGRPAHVISTLDVDDWLTVVSGGTARGVTAESTAQQYRRQGLIYRSIRDAPPVAVYAAWRKTDPPAVLQEVLSLLAALYRPPRANAGGAAPPGRDDRS